MVVQVAPLRVVPSERSRALSLTSPELRKLRAITRHRKSDPLKRTRARVILLAAQAWTNEAIAHEVDLPSAEVDELRERFARCRFHALTNSRPAGPRDAETCANAAATPARIDLTGSERWELQRIVAAHKSQQRMVLRARIVLLAGRGLNNSQIAHELDCELQTVRKWRSRYARSREEGLYDMPRSGRRSRFSPTERCAAIAVLLQPPPAPRSSWTLDMAVEALLAQRVVPAISRETLSRWLRTADIKPHRTRYWLNSKDPDFNAKMAQVIDLYMNRPKGVRVICIDEKTCIPARERLHPDRPMRAGRPRRLEFEYERHGTVHLIAAFDVHTGRVIGECVDTNNSAAFIRFLCRLRRMFPGETLHFILDNGTTHRSRKTPKFMARHPWLGKAVFLPTHSSWLNQIEIWFSVLARQALRHASFSSRAELIDRIQAYIELHNQHCKPYRWTATGEALRA